MLRAKYFRKSLLVSDWLTRGETYSSRFRKSRSNTKSWDLFCSFSFASTKENNQKSCRNIFIRQSCLKKQNILPVFITQKI